MGVPLALPGYEVARRYSSVSSTMDLAREIIAQQSLHKVWAGLVVADHQEAGRGRQGRRWLAGENACMLTGIFCTDRPLADISGYSLAVGLSIVEAFDKVGIQFSLKWPNDLVVVQGQRLRKLGGILIEVEEIKGYRVLLIGIGLNVGRVPAEVSDIAVSLEDLCASAPGRDEVVTMIAAALRSNHEAFFLHGGFKSMRAAWEERSCFVSGATELTIESAPGQLSGIYSGVSDSGALVMIVNGEERVFHSGHLVSSPSVLKTGHSFAGGAG